jgi:hypothetical protein
LEEGRKEGHLKEGRKDIRGREEGHLEEGRKDT